MFYFVNNFKFLRTNCAKFHIQIGRRWKWSGATCLEIGMKIPKIVLSAHLGLESLNNTKTMFEATVSVSEIRYFMLPCRV